MGETPDLFRPQAVAARRRKTALDIRLPEVRLGRALLGGLLLLIPVLLTGWLLYCSLRLTP